MKRLIFLQGLFLLLLVGIGLAQECAVGLEMRLEPAGTKADIEATYLIDCYSEEYGGQVNNVRLHLKSGKGIVVSDSVGVLKAEESDPDYFKLTNMDNYYLLSVRPRVGVVIGPFGSEYGLTATYPAKDTLTTVDDNIKFMPAEAVIAPKLMVQKGNTQTLVDVDISQYKFIIQLPDGSELKESSVPCTISQGTLTCETDSSKISELSIVWREKPLSEQVAKKGMPWVLVGVKTFVGKLFGGLI